MLFSYPLSPSLSLGVVGAGNAHGVAGVERRSRLECTKGWESRQRVAKVTLYDFNTLSALLVLQVWLQHPLALSLLYLVFQNSHATIEILGPPINQNTSQWKEHWKFRGDHLCQNTDSHFSFYFYTVGPTDNQAMRRGQEITHICDSWSMRKFGPK